MGRKFKRWDGATPPKIHFKIWNLMPRPTFKNGGAAQDLSASRHVGARVSSSPCRRRINSSGADEPGRASGQADPARHGLMACAAALAKISLRG